MDYDKDKVDEITLALLYLVTWERQEGSGSRAWKGFDWDTMNRLHKKGFISDPKGKAKSVVTKNLKSCFRPAPDQPVNKC